MPIQVIEPGALTKEMQAKIEEFRFPVDEYSTPELREDELRYDRMYIPRSVYLIYYSPLNSNVLLGVVRIIEKRRLEDKLPIEFATVLSTIVDSRACFVRGTMGTPFSVAFYDPRFPVCEIGGLRAAEIDPTKGITMEARVGALTELIIECDKEVHKRNYTSYFLTCTDKRHMIRLYKDKCHFNEVATILFGKQLWRVLWRDPALDPVVDIVAQGLTNNRSNICH